MGDKSRWSPCAILYTVDPGIPTGRVSLWVTRSPSSKLQHFGEVRSRLLPEMLVNLKQVVMKRFFPGTLAAKHLWLRRQLHLLCRFSRHRRRRTRSFCATWKCFKWKCLNILSPRVALEVSWAESYVFERQPHFAGVIRCTHYNLKKGFYGMVDAKQGIPCISG